MSLASSLHAWLDPTDPVNEVDWYEHVLARNFSCGCRPWETYCPEWRAVVNPPVPSGKVSSFWIHTNSTPVSDALLQREIPRRRYVVLNAWESGLIPKIKRINPNCTVLVYKDLSSVRSYDTHTDARLTPSGMTYAYAKVRPDWQARSAAGAWLQYSGYSGHYQMDVGQLGYQNEWASNVALMRNLGFDGVWMDNALWRRDTYHEGTPVRGYATDEAFREAYRSFFRHVCPKLRAAGLISVANMTDARRVSGGWASYLDAGLDGGFDEWWLTFSDTNMLPEYSEGWRRVVHQITYAEAHGKIALVQPHFSAGSVKPFRYALASFLMGVGDVGLAAFVEANGTDQYGNPTAWHDEYNWDLGAPVDGYVEVKTNVFTRQFTNGMVVVNANKTGSPILRVTLGRYYRDEDGTLVTSLVIPGTTGRIFRGK